MSELENRLNELKNCVGEYPDFPKPGVLFRDIFPIFLDPSKLELLKQCLVETIRKIEPPADCILGLDARGFLLGPLISLELNLPFVPVRKKGKLPGVVVTEEYDLEYGSNTVEVQVESVKNYKSIVIVDDLIATGGSMKAACNLVDKCGGKVTACVAVMELVALNGRNHIPNLISLLQYE